MWKIPREGMSAIIAMRAPEAKCEKSLWGVIMSDSLARNQISSTENRDF